MSKRAFAVVAIAGLVATGAAIVRAADTPLQGAWQIVDQTDVVDISQASADDLRALYGPIAAKAVEGRAPVRPVRVE